MVGFLYQNSPRHRYSNILKSICYRKQMLKKKKCVMKRLQSPKNMYTQLTGILGDRWFIEKPMHRGPDSMSQ